MTFGWTRFFYGAAATLMICLVGLVSLAGQTAPAAPAEEPQLSEKVFKNVQVLKGISVDEFMDTMGMFAAALGYDCSTCHDPAIKQSRAGFALSTPEIQRARGMVTMMNALNKNFFGGEQRVTCFTCHRGHYKPEMIPNFDLQYGDVPEDPNAMLFNPEPGSPEQIFEKYMKAIGGAQKVAGLKSYVATGTYAGFNTGGAEAPVEIFAKAPDQRAMVVHVADGLNVSTYDGRSGWASEDWRPVPLMALTGGNLAGARLDAMLAFPTSIQRAFSKWQMTSSVIDDKPVEVVQGSNPGELPVNFYFDESGLLVRHVRWNKTAVGIVPTQVDYSDYRDVAGVKVPFHIVITWTDGRNTIELKEIKPNVTIDAARFAKPAPFQTR